MKKTILLMMALLVGGTTIAGGLKKYYKYIYTAEQHLVHNNPKGAAAAYKKAFAAHAPFGCDAYNCLLLCLGTDDLATAYSMTDILIDKGVDSAFLQNEMFDHMKLGELWPGIMAHCHRKTADRQKYAALHRLIDSMEAWQDKLVRRSYKEPENTEVKKEEAELYRKFAALFKQYNGFNEETAGLYLENGYIILMPWQGVVVNSFIGSDSSILQQPLIDAIHNGNVRAPQGLNLLNHCKQLKTQPLYYTVNDTMYRAVLLSGPAGATDLTTKKLSRKAKKMKAYVYAPNTGCIADNMVYNFHRTCKTPGGNNPLTDYLLWPSADTYTNLTDENKEIVTTRCAKQ